MDDWYASQENANDAHKLPATPNAPFSPVATCMLAMGLCDSKKEEQWSS